MTLSERAAEKVAEWVGPRIIDDAGKERIAAIIARETGCDEAAELIAGCEWVRWDDPHDGAGGEQCPTCGQEKTDGHATDCKRAKYLAAVNG